MAESPHPWEKPLILFDGLHLVCADLEALHAFAQSCGLKREWFQDHPDHPHYDVFGRMRQAVIRRGAIRASGGTVAMVARRARGLGPVFRERAAAKAGRGGLRRGSGMRYYAAIRWVAPEA